jgi:hypothetical protein
MFRYSPLVAAIVFALTPGVSAALLVTDPGDAGPGTLRQAIVDSNAIDPASGACAASSGIAFSGPFTIRPATPLPALNCAGRIDGGGLVTIDGVDQSIACGLEASAPVTAQGLEIIGFRAAFCGSISAYGSKIYGNSSELSGSAKAAAAGTPSAYLTTSTLNFGNVEIGTVSNSLSLAVVSNGSAPFVINRFEWEYGGPICYGGSFICSTDCVGATLSPGQQCTLAAQFDATYSYPATFSTRVAMYDNGNPNPTYMTLTANAVPPPPLAIAPSSWDFGSVLVGKQGATQTFSVTNPAKRTVYIGPLATTGNFVLQGTDCGTSIGAGASCSADVTFAPTQQGPASGTLDVPGAVLLSAAAAKVIPRASAALTGSGITQGQIQLPSSVDFGAYTLGSRALTQTVELSNNGNTFLLVTSISASPPFEATHNCPSTLGNGASCTITVRFSSPSLGDFKGTLTVVSNDPRGGGVIALHARAVDAPKGQIRLSATHMGFGERLLGTSSASQRVTITNVSNVPAIINSITPSNEDFKLIGTSCAVPVLPAATCFADVAMKPVGFGLRIGQLIVSSNAVGSPHTVDLGGTGCRPFSTPSARSGLRLSCSP